MTEEQLAALERRAKLGMSYVDPADQLWMVDEIRSLRETRYRLQTLLAASQPPPPRDRCDHERMERTERFMERMARRG